MQIYNTVKDKIECVHLDDDWNECEYNNHNNKGNIQSIDKICKNMKHYLQGTETGNEIESNTKTSENQKGSKNLKMQKSKEESEEEWQVHVSQIEDDNELCQQNKNSESINYSENAEGLIENNESEEGRGTPSSSQTKNEDQHGIHKTTFKYKSDINANKYTFPKQDKSEEELNMYIDKRNIFEVLRDMVNKLNDKLPEDEVEMLSNLAKFDLRIPQISQNGIPMIQQEIMDLTKQWKKRKLSDKTMKIIKETQETVGQLKDECLPEAARKGGFSIEENKTEKKVLQTSSNQGDCDCCVNIAQCQNPEHCVFENCQGDCQNIAYEDCHLDKCYKNRFKKKEEIDSEIEESKSKEDIQALREEFMKCLKENTETTLASDIVQLLDKMSKGNFSKKVRNKLKSEIKKFHEKKKAQEAINNEVMFIKIPAAEGLPYVEALLSENDKTNDRFITLLIDCGAEINVIKEEDISEILTTENVSPVKNICITTANGSSSRDVIIGKITVKVRFDEYYEYCCFHILKRGSPLKTSLIGMPFLKQISAEIKIKPEGNCLQAVLFNNKQEKGNAIIPCKNNKKVNTLGVEPEQPQDTIRRKINMSALENAQHLLQGQEQEEGSQNEEQESKGQKYADEIRCLCPRHNPYIKWKLSDEEIDEFEEFLCPQEENREIYFLELDENGSPFSKEFSDDPINPPIENVGEKLLVERDLMSTTLNPKENDSLEISHLDKSDQEKITAILNNYKEVIQSETNRLGKFRYFECSFEVNDAAAANQRNRNIPFDRAPSAIKKIEELKTLGVLEPTNSSLVIFNFVLVKKYQGLRLMSKADKYLAEKSYTSNVEFRLACDASSLNAQIINQPPIIMPRAEDIRRKISNKYLSSIDICDQYFAIPVDSQTRKYTNVYYKEQVLQFNRLVQGVSSSPYHAMASMALTFANVVFKEWVKVKNITKEQFPYSKYSEFSTYFLDDVLIYTKISEGSDVHWLAVDSIMYALSRAGWVLSLRKANFKSEKIKWLGSDLNPHSATSECSFDRASAIINMRQPRSLAESASRSSLILYCASFLPLLKKLLIPIHKMITSNKFTWDKKCAHAYNEIKLLMSLSIRLTLFNPDRVVVIECDASKIAMSANAFQIDENGILQLLDTKSSYLSTSQMRNASVSRECRCITFALEHFQHYILGCRKPVYLLTDAKPLTALKRSKNVNSRFFEETVLLTSFPNLEVCFLEGRSLLLADVITRSFNDVYIKETNPLSDQMASIIPPIPKHLYKRMQKLNNEQLTDFLLSECPKEFVDIFDGKIYYKQKMNHKSEIERLLASISPENSILMLMRKGWQNPNLFNLATIKELLLKQKKLSKTSFEDVIKRHQLAGIKKMADNLDVQDEFLTKIKRNFTVEEEEANIEKMSKKLVLVTTRSRSKLTGEEEVAKVLTRPTKSKKLPRIPCEEHSEEGHERSHDLILASSSLSKIEKLVAAWLALGESLNNTELTDICHQFVSEKCILRKIESYKACLSGIIKRLAEIRSFEICDENGDISTILCFYNFQSDYFKAECNEYEIRIKASKEITLKEFEILSSKIFLFMALNAEYTFVQGECPDLFVDMSVQNVNAFFSDSLVLFNLSDTMLVIKEDQEILSINLSPAATKRKASLMFVPIEKSVIESNFQRFAWNQENMSKETLERALETYYINFIDKTKVLSEKDKDPATAKYVQKYLEGLNLFIISMKLVKKPGALSKEDIFKMQQSDPVLKEIYMKYQRKPVGFKYFIDGNILFYRNRNKEKEEIIRLCIPSYLIKMLTNSFHSIGNSHLSSHSISYSLSQLYHHPNMMDIVKMAVEACVTCSLCHSPNKITISGGDRTFRKNLLPGEIWECDVCYLPITTHNKIPAALVCTDVVTNYVVCFELLKVNSYYTSKAISNLFKTMGLCRIVKCDGGQEFSKSFLKVCANLNVTVVTTLPNCKNQCANAEKSIDLVKRTLVKIVSQYIPSRRQNWVDVLPLALHSINSSILRKTSLSRRMLMFSPYIYHHGRFLIFDPSKDNLSISKLHKRALSSLEQLRTANLLRKKKDKLSEMKEDMIVVHIQDDTKTATMADGTKSLVPASNNIYKIKEMLSGTMGVRVRSLVDNSIRTLPKDQIRPLNLSDAMGIQIDPAVLFQEIKQNRLRTAFKRSKKGMSLPVDLKDLENFGEETEEELEEEEELRRSKRLRGANEESDEKESEESLEENNHESEENREIHQIGKIKPILKKKEDFYDICSLGEIDTEIHRLKLHEFEAVKQALSLSKYLKIGFNNFQNIMDKSKFSFSSLKRYNIPPITDEANKQQTEEIEGSTTKKIQFSSTPKYYSVPRQTLINSIHFYSSAARLICDECCVSVTELQCLDYN